MAAGRRAHIIVLGNEKGGSGKSTTAVHIAVALLHAGLNVAAIDLDGRQKSFARYMENRAAYAAKHGLSLKMPELTTMMDESDAQDRVRLSNLLARYSEPYDAIVIDCPGRDSALSRAAHAAADTLITPINDSFVDFDLLGQVDPDTHKVTRPSLYSELIWECRKERAKRDRGTIDWVVLRTRLSTLDARNTRRVSKALQELSKRIGFRTLPGLSERVIFRELFPKGLTLLDLATIAEERASITMSQVAARHELRELLDGLDLPVLQAQGERARAAG